jgi:phosphoglycerate kinase
MKTIRQLDLAGKRVLIRVDFNVPLKDGVVGDDTRIRETLPTIREALSRGAARVILCSHLGRPKGRDAKLSLAPVAKRLQELLGEPVAFEGEGRVTLLENLRFDAREEANDPTLARELAARCDVYVNDAFGAAHRAHASTEGVARVAAVKAAGLLLAREIEVLGRLLEKPDRPFVVILGGAKVADKIKLIGNILPRVDRLLIGGGMAFTFLKAGGQKIGASILSDVPAPQSGKILLPVDSVLDTGEPCMGDIPDGAKGLDIGPQTVAMFRRALSDARTVFWNGPLGVFEDPRFAVGTQSIVTVLRGLRATKVVGGGDTIAAIAKFGSPSDFTHISTGGGASMEFLEGAPLPGVEALR